MAEVKGRLIRKPVVQIKPSADGVLIRVDDDANPEFWLEVRLTEVEVCVAYAHMREERRIRATESAEPDAPTGPQQS